jgi:hypothetical protein
MDDRDVKEFLLQLGSIHQVLIEQLEIMKRTHKIYEDMVQPYSGGSAGGVATFTGDDPKRPQAA